MRSDKGKLFIRIICILLVALLLLGCVFAILPTGSSSASKYTENMNVRIGISYGSSVTKSYRISSVSGFRIGYCTNENGFVPLCETGVQNAVICLDGNLSYSSGSYVQTSASGALVGGYHIQFSIDTQAESFDSQYSDISGELQKLGIPCYKACINKALCLRAGSFTTYDAANEALKKINAAGKYYCKIVYPSSTGLSVINPSNNSILFEFDGGGSLSLGMSAINAQSGSYYISAPNGYSYDGVFEFNLYSGGISVINIVPLETYIEGVLPYEISSSWNAETQKAFACAVRSYTLANIGKHEKTYGFDLCNTTDCQVYRGVNGVNDAVRNAVRSTKNTVLSYNSKIVSAYYSSSTGGTTASAYDVWGGTSFPYLEAVATPWEKYNSYGNGAWTVEISPAELYNTLIKKGYSGLKGNIASVKINTYAANSSYVKSITFTDVGGNSITISRCDKIRLALSSYLKSANFVVAKGGQSVNITDYNIGVDYTKKVSVSGVRIMTYTGNKVERQGSGLRLITSKGVGTYTSYGALKVISSNGYSSLAPAAYSVFPDLSNASVSKSVKKVTAPGSSSNFVFIGRGWGHGVGMSQYGAKDLGDLGYTYDAIIAAYFPKIILINMKNIT